MMWHGSALSNRERAAAQPPGEGLMIVEFQKPDPLTPTLSLWEREFAEIRINCMSVICHRSDG